MVDLKQEIGFLMPRLESAIKRVVRSGRFILGPEVEQFECEAADFLGVKHAVGLNSGTDALVIALRSVGVCPGDRVITTPFSFFATAEAISLIGACPVFVDIDPHTYALDPSALRFSPGVKAIIVVHLFGHSADLDPIVSFARENKIALIEDVAQAFGGKYCDRRLGSFGDFGCFSFFPSKNLGAYGDAGLLVTDDDRLAGEARKLRNHGSSFRYHHDSFGYNSRLDELQAAILRVKLPFVDEWNENRRRLADNYTRAFSRIGGLQCPTESPGVLHVYHQYTLQLPDGIDRTALQRFLQNHGIASMVYYPVPLHLQSVYKGGVDTLPMAESVAKRVISLPIWPQMSDSAQQSVIDAFRAGYAGTAFRQDSTQRTAPSYAESLIFLN